jgi:hypothetical protein
VSEFIQTAVYWKLAIFKFLSGISKIGLLAFIAAMTAKNWYLLTGFDRFVIIASAIIQMLTYAEGFFDQVVNRLMAGKPPIGTNGNGGTDHYTQPPILGK